MKFKQAQVHSGSNYERSECQSDKLQTSAGKQQEQLWLPIGHGRSDKECLQDPWLWECSFKLAGANWPQGEMWHDWRQKVIKKRTSCFAVTWHHWHLTSLTSLTFDLFWHHWHCFWCFHRGAGDGSLAWWKKSGDGSLACWKNFVCFSLISRYTNTFVGPKYIEIRPICNEIAFSYYLKLRSQSYRLTYYGWCWSGFDTENIWKSILLCIMWFNRGLACTQDNWIYPRPPKARSSRHDWDLKICKEIQYYRFGRSNRLSSKHWT